MKNNPGLAQLIAEVQRPGTNTLIFVDGGYGPRKAAKGWYNEESVFGPTPSEVAPIPSITATVDGQSVSNPHAQYSTVDTLAMAQERRWQDIDTMKKAKAVIGTGMMAGGAGLAGYGASRDDAGTTWAGIGLLAAGALVSASSQSDVRSWEMLPRTVYIIPAALSPGQHTISVNAGTGATGNVQVLSASPTTGHPADNIVYFRLPYIFPPVHHFPMQNCPKMRPSTSSGEIAPVIWPSKSNASRNSAARSSGKRRALSEPSAAKKLAIQYVFGFIQGRAMPLIQRQGAATH